METPELALAISYWLHMLATAAWIGGILLLGLVLYPILEKALPPDEFYRLVHKINRRMDPVGWLSLTVLTATGLIQMSANPNYGGFLSIENRWATAILLKHIAFLGILGTSAFQTWRVAPELERALFLKAHANPKVNPCTHQARIRQLIWINLLLAILVLVFTAVARVA
ncbi:MAG: DUF4149 domain-containing protein [Chloroflexi bacterium]|nr:DUF4149 domain-containing protein [Chloroflexota bacterium]